MFNDQFVVIIYQTFCNIKLVVPYTSKERCDLTTSNAQLDREIVRCLTDPAEEIGYVSFLTTVRISTKESAIVAQQPHHFSVNQSYQAFGRKVISKEF